MMKMRIRFLTPFLSSFFVLFCPLSLRAGKGGTGSLADFRPTGRFALASSGEANELCHDKGEHRAARARPEDGAPDAEIIMSNEADADWKAQRERVQGTL